MKNEKMKNEKMKNEKRKKEQINMGNWKRKTLREEEKVIKLKNMCNEEVIKKTKKQVFLIYENFNKVSIRRFLNENFGIIAYTDLKSQKQIIQ